jgi:thiosulfate/3-mercaptopyruvate sulfurtransferase
MPGSFGPLIAPDELARLSEAPGGPPTILDVRWELATGADRDAYLDGHVPGAVFVDLDRQLSDPPGRGRGRHPLPDPARFGAEMRSLGVSAGRPVVVYDAATAMAAARAWWLLRYFGHPRVAVLDGGLKAWRESGRSLATEVPEPAAGDFEPRPGGMPTVDAAETERLSSRGVLLDARARERFLGEVEPIDPVAGHVPGARSRPTTENVDASGHFRPAVDLRATFESLGVREGQLVAAYCGSGITAAHEVLALELAGYAAALYPGSWSEWVADADRPVATGEEPALPTARED